MSFIFWKIDSTVVLRASLHCSQSASRWKASQFPYDEAISGSQERLCFKTQIPMNLQKQAISLVAFSVWRCCCSFWILAREVFSSWEQTSCLLKSMVEHRHIPLSVNEKKSVALGRNFFSVSQIALMGEWEFLVFCYVVPFPFQSNICFAQTFICSCSCSAKMLVSVEFTHWR